MKKITEHIYTVDGSVRGGVLIQDGHALLIDAPEFPDGKIHRLEQTVDAILLTQHRRPYSGGISYWNAPVWATAGEAELLLSGDKVWSTSHGKYHRYSCIPDRLSPFESIQTQRILADREVISWRGLTITVISFSALSREDCAYLVKDGEKTVLCCGSF